MPPWICHLELIVLRKFLPRLDVEHDMIAAVVEQAARPFVERKFSIDQVAVLVDQIFGAVECTLQFPLHRSAPF